MNKRLLLTMVLADMILVNAQAGSMGPLLQKNNIPWVGTFSIGPTWTTPGSQQSLQLTSQIEKTYTAYKPQNTLADGEVFLGIKKDLPYTR